MDLQSSDMTRIPSLGRIFNRGGAHLALGVDHVGVMLELVAQVVINVAVKEAALATLFSPQKVVLRKKSSINMQPTDMSPDIKVALCVSVIFALGFKFLTSARMRQYRQVCAARRRSLGDRKDRM